MTTLSINLPDSMARKVQELAKQDDISLDQFIAMAVAEKMSAWIADAHMEERARRGSRKKYLAALAKSPDAEPPEEDRWPCP